MEQNESTPTFKMEIQLGILGIVAGLGFFKVDELTSFIGILGQVLNNEGIGGHNLFLLVFIPLVILAYLSYFFSFALALYRMYRGFDITKPILIAISCYFVMYFLLIILMLQDPDLMKNKIDSKPEKTEKVDEQKNEEEKH